MHYYVFVRRDIPIADQACQISHASALGGRDFGYPDGCNLVLLQVESREALLEVAKLLEENEIKFCLHDEPDDEIGPAAIATEMITEKRRKLSRFKLWAA